MPQYLQNGKTFILKEYDRAETFTDFLPAISGVRGIPFWAFLVNRGQCVSSFGVGDKNGAIAEFLPANKAVIDADRLGFRTFVKIDGAVRELFTQDDTEKTYISEPAKLKLTEQSADLYTQVEYVTLCEERIPAMLRKLTVRNDSSMAKRILLADGHSRLLPYGVNDFSVKNMTTLMSAFTHVQTEGAYVVFKHNYSTSDTAEVIKNKGGNFYVSCLSQDQEKVYVYDTQCIFGADSHLKNPEGLLSNDYESLKAYRQSAQYKVPCMFTISDITLQAGESVSVYSAIGRVESLKVLPSYESKLTSPAFYEQNFERNTQLVEEITAPMMIETADKNFDEYVKYCFFDNILRGGMPIQVGKHVVYVYSRKHGDLEREYNWFNIAPNYYSAGSGNYRDVNQNRRNDIFFYPFIEDFNVKLFFNLLQVDGYNPLVVESPKFLYRGETEGLDERVCKILSKEYDIGELAYAVDETLFLKLLDESEIVFRAAFSEGYWTDHFTYNLELLINYGKIYPDRLHALLFNGEEFTYFDSGERVLPHQARVIDKKGQLKSYHFLKKTGEPVQAVKDSDGNVLKVNLLTKLVGLALIKSATLDRAGCGIEMEAGKPGWNDSMNGLPALNGSNVADAMELFRINEYLIQLLEHHDTSVKLLNAQAALFGTLQEHIGTIGRYDAFVSARETFYAALSEDGAYDGTVPIESAHLVCYLKDVNMLIKSGLESVVKDGLYPTFLVYDLPSQQATRYTQKALPLFLEAQAKSFKLHTINNHRLTYESTRRSELYDSVLGLYKTSVDLSAESPELGRVMTFHRGLYERESCFLHMQYKFLLGLMEAGLYREFYDEMERGLVCNFDPNIYRRSVLQNSSFIVSSVSDDVNAAGRGYQPRLTGANSEVLSMVIKMFTDDRLFEYNDGALTFVLAPKLASRMFDADNHAVFGLFGTTKIVYENPDRLDAYRSDVHVTRMRLYADNLDVEVIGDTVDGDLALRIRAGEITCIEALIGKENR